MTGVPQYLHDALGDRYELLEEIGRGGMATVYRAVDRRHERDVAIKVLEPALRDAVAAERFLREIRIEATLQHPHIITLHDSGQVDGCPYFVMPYVAGESLRDRLQRESQLPLEEALRIARDVATALAHAHERGIVHRDVKPHNILLSSGEAMLADFGTASALVTLGIEPLTEDGIAVGTPHYMSPEQASGDRAVDARTDIYALGCVLFEMLAGEPPFTGPTARAIMSRHISERVPSLTIVRPGIPRRIVRVIEKSLAKSPADRYASAQELIRAIDSATLDERSRRWRATTIGTLAGIFIGLAAWIALRPAPPALDRGKVVVFPLEERGLPPTAAGAGTDIALMIAAALEHADPLRPLDVRDRLTPAQRANVTLVTAGERRTLARDRGAGLYIDGVVQGHSDSTTVMLRLHDVAGDSLVVWRTARGPREPVALHHLGIDAVTLLMPSMTDPGRRVDLTALRNRRVDAIALFLLGEREYRLSNFERAQAFYERALGQDSALALAAIKGAQAASWSKSAERAPELELVRLARARDSLLPPRYAFYARALEAYLLGRADTALYWIDLAIEAAPGWAEANTVRGEVHYHLVPLQAGADTLAESAFNAALASDSGFTPPLFHLAEIALRRGDLPRGRAMLQRFRAHQPSRLLLNQLQLMLACLEDGARGYDWMAAATATPRDVLLAGKAFAGAGLGLGCADGAFRSILATDSTQYHWGALLGHHAVLAATGQNVDLVAFVDSVVDAGALQQAMMLYVLDAAAGMPMREHARGAEAFVKRRWGVAYEGLTTRPTLAWLQWIFGVWHAEEGDLTTVRALFVALDSAAGADPFAPQRLYADALAAHIALLQRDTAAAIAALRALSPAVAPDELDWSIGAPLGVERLRLAELLLAQRRYQEAHDVASIFDHPGPMVYVVFLPRSLSLRYRAAIGLGRRDAARAYRQRLSALGRLDLIQALDHPHPTEGP